MKTLLNQLRISGTATLLLAVLLCGLYPLTVWIVGQTLFPDQANGSLLLKERKIRGASLISQRFAGPEYFHPRPSAAGRGYDAEASGGSNLGPVSRALVEAVRQRVIDYRSENRLSPGTPIPADAVTASASGLDPHISPANALLQAPRVARTRGWSESSVREQIARFTEGRDWGALGEPRVNVLLLNMALDARAARSLPGRAGGAG